MLECTKAHIKQSRISKKFSGRGPPDLSLFGEGRRGKGKGNERKGIGERGRGKEEDKGGKGVGGRRFPKQKFTTTPLAG